jgi:hypothetical protein
VIAQQYSVGLRAGMIRGSSPTSRPALGGPPSLLYKGYQGLFPCGGRVKRPGREADHSPPSSAEVKDYVELYLHFPNNPSWCGTQFKEKQGKFL